MMRDAYSTSAKPSAFGGVSEESRRWITVGVGYGWSGKPRNDVRWKALRRFLTAVEEQARKRAIRDLNKDAAIDLRGLVASDELVAGRVRRLRASVGEPSWSSIKTAISNCDILVFDITPTKSIKPSRSTRRRISQKLTSPNVWLEIGYALGQKKTVFLVHSKVGRHRDLPSDLQGLIVGHLPDEGAQVDVSLRNKLTNAMARVLVAGFRNSGAQIEDST
jgi:hypothetical protein